MAEQQRKSNDESRPRFLQRFRDTRVTIDLLVAILTGAIALLSIAFGFQHWVDSRLDASVDRAVTDIQHDIRDLERDVQDTNRDIEWYRNRSERQITRLLERIVELERNHEESD